VLTNLNELQGSCLVSPFSPQQALRNEALTDSFSNEPIYARVPTAQFEIGPVRFEVEGSLPELARCQDAAREMRVEAARLKTIAGTAALKVGQTRRFSEPGGPGKPPLQVYLWAKEDGVTYALPLANTTDNLLGIEAGKRPIEAYDHQSETRYQIDRHLPETGNAGNPTREETTKSINGDVSLPGRDNATGVREAGQILAKRASVYPDDKVITEVELGGDTLREKIIALLHRAGRTEEYLHAVLDVVGTESLEQVEVAQAPAVILMIACKDRLERKRSESDPEPGGLKA